MIPQVTRAPIPPNPRPRFRRLLIVCSALSLSGCVNEQLTYLHNVGPAETIYLGGEVITLEEGRPTAEAVAVKAGRVIAVGSEEQILRLERFDTIRVDLRGMTLVPAVAGDDARLAPAGVKIGSPADFLLLSENPLDLAPDERGRIEVRETIRPGP